MARGGLKRILNILINMKTYNEMQGIGKSKYVVNYHDGKKRHEDGSKFFDIKIFSNKKKKETFINELETQGYTL